MKKKQLNLKKVVAKMKKDLEDIWSAQKAKIEALAAEQVAADIGLVEADRNLKAAQKAYNAALARKTTAEKKLNTFRANLGDE